MKIMFMSKFKVFNIHFFLESIRLFCGYWGCRLLSISLVSLMKHGWCRSGNIFWANSSASISVTICSTSFALVGFLLRHCAMICSVVWLLLRDHSGDCFGVAFIFFLFLLDGFKFLGLVCRFSKSLFLFVCLNEDCPCLDPLLCQNVAFFFSAFPIFLLECFLYLFT